MVKEEKNTIQLGLRIDKELLDEIETLANSEGVDKMSWIRRALAVYVDDQKTAMSKEAVKDYINLIIDEEELKEFADFTKIPKDIVNARNDVINKLKNEAHK